MQSAVDRNLAWGECDLTPDLVSNEISLKPWHTEKRYTYGPERLTVEGEEDESLYNLAGAYQPLRGMILRRLLEAGDMTLPWKSWVNAQSGSGYLVVTESGWKFYPPKTR